MPRIVINKCHGSFGLSEAVYEWLIELDVPVRPYNERATESDSDSCVIYDLDADGMLKAAEIFRRLVPERYVDDWFRNHRDDPLLVWVVEGLGDRANGPHAKLAIVDVPDDVEWEIQEDHGNEWVAEVHRTWE